ERLFGSDVDTQELSTVADRLTEIVATLDTSGRPLASGNQAVTPPAEPWARLWRAWTALREYRGDGHVATLVSNDLSVPEVQVLSATWGHERYDLDMLRATRNLTDEVWSAAQAALASRGLLDSNGALSDSGRNLREDIESRTDRASMRAWSQLSDAELRQVHTFTLDLSTRIIDSGQFPARTAVGSPWPPPAL
ncbi:MAG: hypothetical protein WC005_11550, partial [Candidatus Nanopelagicales bacterium]